MLPRSQPLLGGRDSNLLLVYLSTCLIQLSTPCVVLCNTFSSWRPSSSYHRFFGDTTDDPRLVRAEAVCHRYHLSCSLVPSFTQPSQSRRPLRVKTGQQLGLRIPASSTHHPANCRLRTRFDYIVDAAFSIRLCSLSSATVTGQLVEKTDWSIESTQRSELIRPLAGQASSGCVLSCCRARSHHNPLRPEHHTYCRQRTSPSLRPTVQSYWPLLLTLPLGGLPERTPRPALLSRTALWPRRRIRSYRALGSGSLSFDS